MLVIYGLGNNEDKYLRTKHNIGRLIVENIVGSLGGSFESQEGCRVCKISPELWYVYSEGYMNNSGQPLSKLLKYFKIDTLSKDFQLVVVQDDSDQLSGNSKLTVGGGSAGHNGIISSYSHLLPLGITVDKIWRLKLGVRPAGNKLKSETFVLSPLTSEDFKLVVDLTDIYSKTQTLWASRNFERLQNFFNQKALPNKQELVQKSA
jgi:peptidyl-tRNA hydrolase, PTH1 family